jgi:peptide/nickel transport system substrate-binding protein
VHDFLVVHDGSGGYHPQLAVEVPSIEKGTWRLNPDGTMDTTWKIRPNVTWQDGTPFTSADLAFAHQLFTDRFFNPVAYVGDIRLMESVTTPDPLTLVVHWSSTAPNAYRAYGLDPMPRHLLEELYLTNKEALRTTPLLDSQFVGLGPYRIVRWDPGVELEFARYDGYHAGRPPLDSVVVTYMSDGNTMVAAILSGATDVVRPPSVGLDVASEVKRRWEGTGNQVATELGNMRWLRIQYNPAFADLKYGLTQRPVRQALYQAIDRQALVEVVGQGLAPVADSWILPTDPLKSQLDSAVPRYPYDPAASARLLEQAGWVKGSDGVLVRQPDGERFESTLSVRPTTGADQDAPIITAGWKAIGANVGYYLIPAALASDRSYQAKAPLATLSATGLDSFEIISVIHSSEVASEANRWNGANWGGYTNPRVDDIINKLVATIPTDERVALRRQLLQEVLGTELAVLPLYWTTNPVFLLKGVKMPWRVAEWDKA